LAIRDLRHSLPTLFLSIHGRRIAIGYDNPIDGGLKYTTMQIPVGMIYDRFNPGRILFAAFAVCALATIVFGLSNYYPLSIAMRVLIGVGASFGYIGTLIIGASWFPPRYFATYGGFAQVIGVFGAMIGQGPLAALTHSIGWRGTTIAAGFFGLFLALMVLLVVKTGPHRTPIAERKKKASLSAVLKLPQNWFAALYGFSTWAPITIFAALWGVPFMHKTYNIHLITAASFLILIWIGVAVGGPILGWLSLRVNGRKIPMALASSCGVVSSILLIYFNNHFGMVTFIILFLYGFAGSALVLAFATINEINEKQNLGTAAGFTNMAVVTGGLILVPLCGYIIQKLWDGTYLNGSPDYTLHEYRIALIMVPISFIVALITALFLLKETNYQHDI
jgi:MFS family permease